MLFFLPPTLTIVDAQGFKAGLLKPDASGSWTLELDDPEG